MRKLLALLVAAGLLTCVAGCPKKEPAKPTPTAGKPRSTGIDVTPPPGDSKPGDTKPGDTKPGDTKPGDAKPGDAKPGDAKPGDAKPDDKKPTKKNDDK